MDVGEVGSPCLGGRVLLLPSRCIDSAIIQQALAGPCGVWGGGAQVKQTWSCPQRPEVAVVWTVTLAEQYKSGPCLQNAVYVRGKSESQHSAEQVMTGSQKARGICWVTEGRRRERIEDR